MSLFFIISRKTSFILRAYYMPQNYFPLVFKKACYLRHHIVIKLKINVKKKYLQDLF